MTILTPTDAALGHDRPMRAVLAVLAVPLLGGCVCTLVGGSDGLIVDLAWQPTAPTTGSVDFIVRTDGHEVVSTLTVLDEVTYQCTSCGFELDAGDERLLIDVSLFDVRVAYEGEGHGGPGVVELEVRRDGQRLSLATFTPTYEWFQPNGDGCSPRVLQASDRLVVPAP